MEGEKVKYFSGGAFFVPKFVWGAVAFAIIAICGVYVFKVYSANSSSASFNVGGTHGVNAEIKVADTVNNVVSSIERATSTVNAVSNELFPDIGNMMIVYNVDRLYVEKLQKGRSDIQRIAWLLEGVQESLKELNLGNEMKAANTVSNAVSSIASATSTVNTVGNELFPEIKNMMIIYNVDSGYVEKLEKGRSDMQGITRLLEGVQESLRIMNWGSVTAK